MNGELGMQNLLCAPLHFFNSQFRIHNSELPQPPAPFFQTLEVEG
jgi:hypothetical protein